MARYKPRRQHRHDVLVREGFTRAEAQAVSQFKFNLPYIKLLRADRKELIRDLIKEKATIAERRNRLRLVYQINDWQDAYAMVRDYRKRSIDTGSYTPPQKPRKDLDKGDVRAQKRRYRERQRQRQEPIGEVVFNEETGRYEPRYY